MSKPDREAKLDRAHPDLSIRRQCTLLTISRSGVYRPKPANDDDDLALMRRIDELFLAYPFLGSRRMAAMLSADGAVGLSASFCSRISAISRSRCRRSAPHLSGVSFSASRGAALALSA